MFWCHEACYPVKIHKLATFLFKPQGSKHVKKSSSLYFGNYSICMVETKTKNMNYYIC